MPKPIYNPAAEPTTGNTTAAELYQQRYENIQRLQNALKRAMRAHKREADRTPYNWGNAADLRFIETQLEEAIAFLNPQPNDD